MASQTWMSLLNPASVQASGAGAVINTATTATISPVTGSTADVAQVMPPGLPGGWYPGAIIRVLAHGFVTFTGSGSTQTYFLASRVANAGATYITLATTATLSGGLLSTGTVPWRMTAIIRCTAVASSGNTLATFGEMPFSIGGAPSYTGGANTETAYLNAAGGGESLAAVDTTQLQGISLRCTTVGTTASVQLVQWLVEAVC